jgi:hypothetical protein
MLLGPKPYASSSECASVAVSGVVEGLLDQFVNMGRSASQIADHCGKIQKSSPNCSISGQADESRGAFEGVIKGREESFGSWKNSGRMLQSTGN